MGVSLNVHVDLLLGVSCFDNNGVYEARLIIVFTTMLTAGKWLKIDSSEFRKFVAERRNNYEVDELDVAMS